jgi:hypothetical protein
MNALIVNEVQITGNDLAGAVGLNANRLKTPEMARNKK